MFGRTCSCREIDRNQENRFDQAALNSKSCVFINCRWWHISLVVRCNLVHNRYAWFYQWPVLKIDSTLAIAKIITKHSTTQADSHLAGVLAGTKSNTDRNKSFMNLMSQKVTMAELTQAHSMMDERAANLSRCRRRSARFNTAHILTTSVARRNQLSYYAKLDQITMRIRALVSAQLQSCLSRNSCAVQVFALIR